MSAKKGLISAFFGVALSSFFTIISRHPSIPLAISFFVVISFLSFLLMLPLESMVRNSKEMVGKSKLKFLVSIIIYTAALLFLLAIAIVMIP